MWYRDYFIDAIDSLRGTAERVTLYAPTTTMRLIIRSSCMGARRRHRRRRHHQAGGSLTPSTCRPFRPTSSVTATLPPIQRDLRYFCILWRGDPPPQRWE